MYKLMHESGWAGATSTVGLYPLETLRTRLAMGDYDNMLHAVKAVTAEEGFMAFYQVPGSHCSSERKVPRRKKRKEKSTPLGVMTGVSVPRSSPRLHAAHVSLMI